MLTQDPTADTAGFRLSPQQEQLWRGEPDGPRLVAQGVIDISASDPPVVRSALERIVARHEILRTTFARQPGVKLPAQVIHDELQPDWTEVSVAAALELTAAELVTVAENAVRGSFLPDAAKAELLGRIRNEASRA